MVILEFQASGRVVDYNGRMVPNASKWIDGIDANLSVAEAARRSLDTRLTVVIQALPLAAYLAEHDVEHVHRLRVATRRAIAAIELYRDWLPTKSADWLKRRLKKIRRAAGAARDLDVMAARLERDYGDRARLVLDLLRQKRQKVQPAIMQCAAKCGKRDRLVKKIAKLLGGIRASQNGDDAEPKFGAWAASEMTKSSQAFFLSMPADWDDTTALHEFRIRGKALRYTMELLASAFGSEFRKSTYGIVSELQERLGKVQDHTAAKLILCEWAEETDDRELETQLQEVAEEERDRLIEAVAKYKKWWDDARLESLRQGIARAGKDGVWRDALELE